MTGVSAFDGIAAAYDAQWSHSSIGLLQRAAVWRHLDSLVRPGMRVLDLGCGTGEDALRLMERGALVDAVDASPAMVEVARSKDVPAGVARIEDLTGFSEVYDLALSNFGALNCVEDLSALGRDLAALVRPGAYAALCVLNAFCAWELVFYAMRGQWRKAFRRLRGTAPSGFGTQVFYHAAADLQAALWPAFSLIGDTGIGIAIPPSYGPRWSDAALARCAALDRRLENTALGRAIADHRLLIFQRTEA